MITDAKDRNWCKKVNQRKVWEGSVLFSAYFKIRTPRNITVQSAMAEPQHPGYGWSHHLTCCSLSSMRWYHITLLGDTGPDETNW